MGRMQQISQEMRFNQGSKDRQQMSRETKKTPHEGILFEILMG